MYTVEKIVKSSPGRPYLYDSDLFRASIINNRTRDNIAAFLATYLVELIEIKYYQYPRPAKHALEYCANNLDALIILRSHQKLRTARRILEGCGVKSENQPLSKAS